jgi:UDP-glucose:(glucosyl)LPS alpha-1,2-glucosyltransferase
VADPLVAVILPPREGFGSGRAGALGLLARRYATAPGFRTLVIGGPQETPTFPGIPFQTIQPANWWPGNINLRYVAAMVGPLRRARPALIEVHNRPEIALSLARLFRRTPVGLLLNNDPTDMRAARSPDARTRLLRVLRPVMASSNYLRQRFMGGVDPAAGQAALLHNCIDLDVIPPPLDREKLILFAGRVVPDKAPDSFISACAMALPSLPGWRAEIIGADGMGASSRETDYVIVPSRWNEPFGLTALEAIACGAPLIVSPRGGLPEVAGDAALYADPDDPAQIATAILRLANDPEQRATLSDAGRARARLFDTRIAAERLAALRHAALNGHALV